MKKEILRENREDDPMFYCQTKNVLNTSTNTCEISNWLGVFEGDFSSLIGQDLVNWNGKKITISKILELGNRNGKKAICKMISRIIFLVSKNLNEIKTKFLKGKFTAKCEIF